MTQPRVLVVDDNELDLTIARDFLEEGGFVVDTVKSGEEALEKLDSVEYGLIVTDLVMPGMDGYTLADAVKKRRGPPVILVTAEERAKSSHTVSNLHKPYTKASLVTAARMLCKAGAASPQAKTAASPADSPTAKPSPKPSPKPSVKASPAAAGPSSFKRSSQARRPDAEPESKGLLRRLFGKD